MNGNESRLGCLKNPAMVILGLGAVGVVAFFAQEIPPALSRIQAFLDTGSNINQNFSGAVDAMNEGEGSIPPEQSLPLPTVQPEIQPQESAQEPAVQEQTQPQTSGVLYCESTFAPGQKRFVNEPPHTGDTSKCVEVNGQPVWESIK